MLLRGLGHQNDGDSLAAWSGKEKKSERERKRENLSISVSLRFSLRVCRPISLPPALDALFIQHPLWRVSPSLSQVSLRIDVFVRLVLNSARPFYLPFFSPREFRHTISPLVSLRRGKVRFIFYYSSCLSDMFRSILRPCDPLRFYLGPTWNLFREFDILDIRYVCGGKALHLSHVTSFMRSLELLPYSAYLRSTSGFYANLITQMRDNILNVFVIFICMMQSTRF